MAQNAEEALDWAKHEGEILDLFVIQNKTLKQVMAHMTQKHEFRATERQYKYRFPSLKNVKAKEWIWLDQEMHRRAAIGKESEPCLYGRPLPPDRISRELARHQSNMSTATFSNHQPNPSPQRISVRTPPPRNGTASELVISHLDMDVRNGTDKGADINAMPAVEGGITALQGAAISGNIVLAKLLLSQGANVNAAPSFSEGRYAIEGAAEHGRLDMVQLLLNPGAMGNVSRGTGFKYAIELAEENGHFPIANMLKDVTKAGE